MPAAVLVINQAESRSSEGSDRKTSNVWPLGLEMLSEQGLKSGPLTSTMNLKRAASKAFQGENIKLKIKKKNALVKSGWISEGKAFTLS